MLTALNEAGVRFVLIGGMAAILHGDAGATVDLDVVPERSGENHSRSPIGSTACVERCGSGAGSISTA